MLLGADDFLPLFVWVLVQSGMVAAEIEADYMWGLLHPSLLSGEGGYYLTTLSSAVHVLKSFRACSEEYIAAGAPFNVRILLFVKSFTMRIVLIFTFLLLNFMYIYIGF